MEGPWRDRQGATSTCRHSNETQIRFGVAAVTADFTSAQLLLQQLRVSRYQKARRLVVNRQSSQEEDSTRYSRAALLMAQC